MKIQVTLLLVCGILFVTGSPVEKADKTDKVELIEKNEKISSSKKVASIEQDTSDEKLILSEKLTSHEKVDSSEKSISSEKVNSMEEIDTLKVELLSDEKLKLSSSEKLRSNEKHASEKKLTSEKKLVSSEKLDSSKKFDAIESVESHKSIETHEANDSPSSESVESEEVSRQSPIDEVHSVIQNVLVESTTYLESEPAVSDVLRKIGPVELGLRNTVATSAAITEQIYLEMTAMNAETSHMISSKSEIVTAHAMNELFAPLSKVENEIKKTQTCGQRFEQSLNFIFTDIDINLKQCNKNLTAFDEQFKHVNLGSLTSLSIIAEEMSTLPRSCDISRNFAAGTFCVVNNLAELNERAVSDVGTITENTKLVLEKIKNTVKATEMCQTKLVEKVTEKLNKLSKDVHEKCIDRKE